MYRVDTQTMYRVDTQTDVSEVLLAAAERSLAKGLGFRV